MSEVERLGRTTTHLFDLANRKIGVMNANGYVNTQDARGNLSTKVFDNANRAITAINTLSNRFIVNF